MASSAAASTSALTKTVVTAAQRGNLCRTSQDTSGSRPIARKSATPMRVSADRASARACTAP
jgi:hypothetical protein